MKKLSHCLNIFKRENTNAPGTKRVVSAREEKIEQGARDFAKRFEDVMRDLANG